MRSNNAITFGILIALAAGTIGVQASPLQMAQVRVSSEHGVDTSRAAPAPIAIPPTRFASRPANVVYDGLGDRNSAIDAYNVAVANARPQTPIEAPARIQSDAAIRMSAAKAGPLYYGQVYDSMSSHPLAGATITLGQVPNAWTCNATLSCGRPAGKLYRATTNASGAFGIAIVPPGEYMLTLSKSAAYATLHMQIIVHAGHTRIGLRLLALSPDEQAWLTQLNYYRSFFVYPRSYAVAIDQYAEILARRWALNTTEGITQYTDAGYVLYEQEYVKSEGAMYGAAGALDLVYGNGNYTQADQAWMSEKANCPHGDWQTCAFTETTGHYMNLADTQDVWVGVGETNILESANLPWPGTSAYDVMTVMNTASPGIP